MTIVKPFLSLSNILIPNEQVFSPPSLTDGLSQEVDFELRVRGCELIQEAGVLLKLPQVSIATAQLLYQRYFFIKSFVKYNFEVIAMATTFLASKIDESPRRPRDVINVFHHIRQLENKEKISTLILDQYYINVKNQVIKSERRILKELGFAVHSQHPHKLLIIYLQTLECEKNQKLVQISWNYLNDSYKTNVFMRYQPPSIACACIYLAARHLQFPLPNNPAWYTIFNVTLEDIQDICGQLFKLYTRTPISLKNLDKALNVARKLYESNKIKGLEVTPLHDSPTNFILHPSAKEVDETVKNSPPAQITEITETEPNSAPPNNEVEEHDILLAQQRQSLLFSIQEQKKQKKPHNNMTSGNKDPTTSKSRTDSKSDSPKTKKDDTGNESDDQRQRKSKSNKLRHAKHERYNEENVNFRKSSKKDVFKSSSFATNEISSLSKIRSSPSSAKYSKNKSSTKQPYQETASFFKSTSKYDPMAPKKRILISTSFNSPVSNSPLSSNDGEGASRQHKKHSNKKKHKH